MKLFIDSAELTDLAAIKNSPFIHGITTNPKLIAKGMNKTSVKEEEYIEYLARLRKYTSGELFIQITENETDGIIAEVKKIKEEIPGPIVFKIPATPSGFFATAILAKEKTVIASTAVYTASQSYLAISAGSTYVIPYYSKIDQHDKQGIDTIREILQICGAERLLVASIKNESTLYFLLMEGVKNFTIPYPLFEALSICDLTEEAVEEFNEALQIEWKKKLH